LDDDVEQVAFVDAQEIFRHQQVAGGGNGNEFGDSLDDSQMTATIQSGMNHLNAKGARLASKNRRAAHFFC